MKKAKFNRGWHSIVIHRAVMFLAVLAVGLGGFLFLEIAQEPVQASNPVSGSINNTTTDPTPGITWVGDAPGGASNGESTCQNNPAPLPGKLPYSPGINCDAFTLTVTGAATDFVGKRIRVRFTWISPTNDYDMVIRKESGTTPGLDATDPIVATSGNGITNFEETSFDPATTGTGVYYVNRGNGNQYYRVTAVNAYGESPRNIKTFVRQGE